MKFEGEKDIEYIRKFVASGSKALLKKIDDGAKPHCEPRPQSFWGCQVDGISCHRVECGDTHCLLYLIVQSVCDWCSSVSVKTSLVWNPIFHLMHFKSGDSILIPSCGKWDEHWLHSWSWFCEATHESVASRQHNSTPGCLWCSALHALTCRSCRGGRAVPRFQVEWGDEPEQVTIHVNRTIGVVWRILGETQNTNQSNSLTKGEKEKERRKEPWKQGRKEVSHSWKSCFESLRCALFAHQIRGRNFLQIGTEIRSLSENHHVSSQVACQQHAFSPRMLLWSRLVAPVPASWTARGCTRVSCPFQSSRINILSFLPAALCQFASWKSWKRLCGFLFRKWQFGPFHLWNWTENAQWRL